jgi:diguanylate cyclase (GGDEF)-like protein
MTSSLPRNSGKRGAAAIAAFATILLCVVGLVASGSGALYLPAWVDFIAAIATVAAASYFALASRRARSEAALAEAHLATLEKQLECDPLTHLMNRTAFNKALDDLKSFQTSPGLVMVLFFDLDRFKEVNDTLGHRVGDQLLVAVAKRAGTLLSECRAFARLGGDEFAAILPTSGSAAAHAVGNAIVDVMNQQFVIDDHSINVAASVGIAIGDAMLDDGHDLLRRADAAMYEAKGASRGRCHIFDDMLSGRQLHESFVRIELSRSLAEESLSLHFQPLVDARTGAISSVECLLRATAPGLQNVDTATLISIAEKSGQIIPLTDWTMDSAFAAIRAMRSTPVALNISPIYFRQPQFVHEVTDRLLATGTPPELLTIEITEGVLIADIATARESIARLREIGVKVYLDDFGTCYSSLSYLQHFELDGLKLDKSFLRNIADRKKATQVIKSMIDFGHSLDMRVVMEGVESDWQVRLLQLLGCDLLQGYVLAAPMPLDEFNQWRATWTFAPGASGVDAPAPAAVKNRGR